MKRKVICFITVLSLFTVLLNINAYAITSKTQQQALSWVSSLNGKQAGSSGECVSLIKAYYEYLGYTSPGGNACDYTWNKIPDGSGWTREKGGVPNPGDIIIYTGTTYGHIAIHESTNVSWHQNWNRSTVERVSRKYNQSFTYAGRLLFIGGAYT